MPEIGEQKTFPNGKVGRWDGAGWEHVPDAGASPVAPPEAAASNTSELNPAGPSLTRSLATNVAAPMAGYMGGGALAGKPGAVVGATLGTAAGDLWNTVADHGQNPFGPMQADTSHLGPNAPPTMYDEMKRLLGAAGGAAVGAYGAPLLDKLPGPASLKNIGLGTAAGAVTGGQYGHPGIGAAIGAGMGGYNAARSMGTFAKWLVTPKLGPQEAFGTNVGEPPVSGSPTAPGAPGPKLPGSVIPPDPDPGDFTPRMNAMWAKKGGSPSGDIRGGQPSQPSQPPMPTSAQVSPQGRVPTITNPRTGAPMTRPNNFQPRSTEIPLQAPSSMGGLIQSAPDGLDALTTVPRASNLPRVGNSVMPNLSKSPNLSYGADVTTPGDYVTPQLEQSAPSEAPWEDHVSRSAAVGRPPARTSTQGATYSVNRTPEEALRGLHLPGDPVSEVNDLPNGGPKVKPGGSVDPAKAEFPPSWKEGQDPSTWNDTWNMDYNKAMGNPTPNAALQALMDRLRSAVARKP